VALYYEPLCYGSFAGFTNNLVERSSLSLYGYGNPVVHWTVTIGLQNNLFFGGNLTLYYDVGTDTNSYPNWTVYDNAFDGLSLSEGGNRTNLILNGYNGYINTSPELSGVVTNNVTLTSFTYTNSWLGRYYQQSTNFVNAGSTNANAVGLYHYTTQASQVPETNSIVDIGFHYVALDSNGNPLDNNDDGIPDYLEDANGNGLIDSGEIGWNVVGDLGLKVIITKPANNSTLP
jgi:hypothetical protein